MDIVEDHKYFYSEGKIIEGGPDIMNNIQKCFSSNNKVECLAETAKSVYKYYFERLSQIQVNKHNARIQSIIRRFLSTLDTNLGENYIIAFNKFKQITPGDYYGLKNVISGNYTSIISEMLHVDGFPMLNQALDKSGRGFMEGATPDNQCYGALGELLSTDTCYICGLCLEPMQYQVGCPTACEHVVNVFEALKFYVGLYNSQSPESSINKLKKLEYKWSCACCNYNKRQMNFIETNKNAIWRVRDSAIKKVLELSIDNNHKCCNKNHEEINLNERIRITKKQMQDICDNLNTNYPINQILIQGMDPDKKTKSLKLLEFICVISNISINGIQTVFNKVARDFLKKGSISSKNSNPKKNSKVIKTTRQVKPSIDYLKKEYIPRIRGGGEINEPTYSIEQYIDESNFVDIYNVIVNELNTKIEQELMNIRLLYAAYDLLDQYTPNPPIQATNTESWRMLQPWNNQEAWQNPERPTVMGYGKKTKRNKKKRTHKKQDKKKQNKTKRNKK
ncbi:hypothetical protein OAS95_04235 [Pelagibacteraceae bacterium]|nr:hypothetical protein [Pelagibacteraceae bacterium]